MKKILTLSITVISLCLITTTLTGNWGSHFKKAACERSCEEVYTKCMEKARKAVEREGESNFESDIKYEARFAACQDQKEKCMKGCD